MLRFLHTSDLQIGHPFANFPADVAQRLRDARVEAFRRVLLLARERQAAFVLVAGDLFDSHTLPDREIVRTCDAIRDAGVPVYVIPGNHDHGGPGSVWSDPRFVRHRPELLEVCLDGRPRVVADGACVLLPAPLLRRHEPGDPAQHVTAELGSDLAPEAIRVAFAHGGVIGFAKEGEATNLLDPDLVRRARLDYFALGDWHGTKQVAERVWYAGTPETDRFKDNAPGHALLVEIAERGAVPRVEVARTTAFTWLRHTTHLSGVSDVDALASWLGEVEDPSHALVRLELGGALSFAEKRRLEDEILRDADARFHHVRRRGPGVVGLPSEEEIRELTTEGFVGAAVDELATRAKEDPAAARALELLYALRFSEGASC